MGELICHLWGDYLLQNHWVATKKIRSTPIAILHGCLYTLPFVFLTRNLLALGIICLSHILIDRTRFANRYCQVANWRSDTPGGFPPEAPKWIRDWVVILCDNTIHLTINHFALLLK
jgi:hypothetical protein